ncbi:unnamed protein product [Schistocephalus solidus]|uniref:PDZ domain-containing protein n=1 Tax=Schistocephalus solidus TaxID=70667 RepID=A0A183SR54_SCHSO|nr:unnamed protein product [Schistocephalus solidus]
MFDTEKVPIGSVVVDFKLLFALSDCQGTVQVSQVRAGGSAEQAGLQRGSRIVAVNGQSVDSLTFLQVSNLIRRSR